MWVVNEIQGPGRAQSVLSLGLEGARAKECL